MLIIFAGSGLSVLALALVLYLILRVIWGVKGKPFRGEPDFFELLNGIALLLVTVGLLVFTGYRLYRGYLGY
jgi:hypothetical protein